MAKTLSTMLPLRTQAPDFSLTATDGKTYSLASFPNSKGYLIMFICNHCPYVIHIRETLVKLAKDFQKKGIAVFAINSNDTEAYPEDSPEKMKDDAQNHHYTFPYLFDESQDVAKTYKAACTPDFFLFNAAKELVYRGQMDGSRPGNGIKNDGVDLQKAVNDLLSGRGISPEQKPSMGCNIKWKAAN